MRSERFVISDRSWAIMEPLLPGSARDRGRTARDNRLFLEAVLWKVRVGGPWRDLPSGFGEWNSVFRRFRRWAQRGVFNGFSRLYRVIPTLNMFLSMARSSASTRKRVAQKGDSQSGHRAFERRIDHQSSGPHRCVRQSGALQAAARPAR